MKPTSCHSLLAKYPSLTVGAGLVLGTSAELCEGAILYTDIPDITLEDGERVSFDVMHTYGSPYYSTGLTKGNFEISVHGVILYNVYGAGAPKNGTTQPYYNYWQVGNNGDVLQFDLNDTIKADTTADLQTADGYLYLNSDSYWSVGTGFAGLMIADTPGDTSTYRYGWARITFGQENDTYIVTLHDFAVELDPGVPIKAGQIPEPSSIALLAMGAAGIAYARRRRKAA